MKLYRVQTYKEIYFKSIYKPLFYDPVAEMNKTYEKDPAQFVGEILDLASMDDGLWLFMGENEQLWLKEVARCAGSATPALWTRWILLQKQWFETGPRSEQLWKDILSCGHEIWNLSEQAGKNALAAQRFWESVRSSPLWQEIYMKGVNKSTGEIPGGWNMQDQMWLADYYVRGFLDGKISAREVRAAMDRPSVMDLISKALAPIAALGGIVLAQIGLLAIAAGCIAVLIWNPKEWGRKVTHYYEGRHLMVYDEYLWWADMVGRTPQGHYYYHCCAELQAKRLTHKAYYPGGPMGRDEFILTTWPVPIEKVDNWYWLFWPTEIDAVFVGLCTKRTDPLLTVCESFRINELPPTEPYLDGSGHLKYRRPKWWKETEGEGCMRPAADWCKEYYHWEEIIPS
ncbi:MAG: hypothetical protein MUP64_10620 [Anaerolineae bacterium]|nr:hypothetical protein [Anaerolineae bacterium]